MVRADSKSPDRPGLILLLSSCEFVRTARRVLCNPPPSCVDCQCLGVVCVVNMGQTSSKTAVVEGFVAPGYESVKEMFEENFSRGADESSQLCVYVAGEMVVDLWGSTTISSYTGDTLTNVFSSTKSITAIAMAALVDLGLINYSDKICKHWPEFAENDKGEITIADLMRHEAGLASFDTPLEVEDTLRENIKKNRVGEVIAKQKPVYPPEKREYHAITRGWVANEIFRRVHPEGKTIGEFLDEKIARPLDIDVYIGVPPSKEKDYAPVHEFKAGKMLRESFKPASSRAIDLGFLELMKVMNMFRKLVGAAKPIFKQYKDHNMKKFGPLYNIDEMRRGETSSANGNCSARGLAKLGAAMACQGTLGGVTVLSNKAWQALHAEPTAVTMMGLLPTNFTQGGVNKFEEEGGAGRDGYYGWFGYGGSVFEWHPDLQIGFGYTVTLLHWQDPFTNNKGRRLQQEVANCVRKLKK